MVKVGMLDGTDERMASRDTCTDAVTARLKRSMDKRGGIYVIYN